MNVSISDFSHRFNKTYLTVSGEKKRKEYSINFESFKEENRQRNRVMRTGKKPNDFICITN